MGEAARETLNRLTSNGDPCLLCLTFQSFRLQPPLVIPGLICFIQGYPSATLVIRCAGNDGNLGFAGFQQARHNDRPNRVRHPTDQLFAFSCSAPPLARTQLLSANGFRSTHEGTYTLLIKQHHRRTSRHSPSAVHYSPPTETQHPELSSQTNQSRKVPSKQFAQLNNVCNCINLSASNYQADGTRRVPTTLPSLRTGLADLPHPALRSMVYRQAGQTADA